MAANKMLRAAVFAVLDLALSGTGVRAAASFLPTCTQLFPARVSHLLHPTAAVWLGAVLGCPCTVSPAVKEKNAC